jgi:hypothetical protein
VLLLLVAGGEHEHLRARADAQHGGHGVEAAALRHADVEEQDVRRVCQTSSTMSSALSASATTSMSSSISEHGAQALAEERVVVDDHDAGASIALREASSCRTSSERLRSRSLAPVHRDDEGDLDAAAEVWHDSRGARPMATVGRSRMDHAARLRDRGDSRVVPVDCGSLPYFPEIPTR